MPERSSISQICQWGLETTYGTSTAANKLLQTLAVEMGPTVEISKYAGTGMKFDVVAALNKEWTEGDLSGPITYTELIYPLSSVLTSTTPTGTTAKSWVFTPANSAADTPKSFTVEQGSSVRAHKSTGVLVTAFGMSFTRDEVTLSGSLLGKAITDNVTLTTTPTAIAILPVLPTQVKVYLADTAAGLAGATALARAVSASWNISNRFAPIWVLNGSGDFPATVETKPDLECKLMVEADAEGMALLSTMRTSSTKFMRIEAIGSLISGSDYYKLTVDTSCKVTDVSRFSDENGLYAIEWTLGGFYNSTAGWATQVTVVNELATL